MAEVENFVAQFLLCIQQTINTFNTRPLNRHHRFGPVTGRPNHNLRTRRSGGGDFHVGEFHAKSWRIFTGASALHRMRYHHDRRLYGKAIINRSKHKGLCAAAGFAGAAKASFINVRQRRQKIESADTVPGLQPHQINVPQQVRVIGGKTTVTFIEIHFVRITLRILSKERIVITNHVVGERDHSLLGKIDAPRRNAPGSGVGQATIFPMTVWIQNAREWTRAFA